MKIEKHDRTVILAFSAIIPIVLVSVVIAGNSIPNVNFNPYMDGTSESATHKYVNIPYEKPEPAQEPTPEPEPVVEEDTDYEASYDESYDDSYEEPYYEDYSESYDSGYSGYDSSNGGQLSYSNGVNYYDGHRETWYSSNESGGAATAVPVPGLYCDENGIYRDADGYVVVASDDRGYGSTVETSWGTGKVYDNFGGSAAGTDAVDIYVNWM